MCQVALKNKIFNGISFCLGVSHPKPRGNFLDIANLLTFSASYNKIRFYKKFVAGNRESVNPGVEHHTKRLVKKLIKLCNVPTD